MADTPGTPESAFPPRPLPATYWVVPGRLLAGEHPGSQSRADTMDRLRRFLVAGVTCFVDLTEPGELPSYESLLTQVASLADVHRELSGRTRTLVDALKSPVVDVQNTTAQRALTKDVLDAIPAGRSHLTQAVLVPGITTTQGSARGNRTTTVRRRGAAAGSG